MNPPTATPNVFEMQSNVEKGTAHSPEKGAIDQIESNGLTCRIHAAPLEYRKIVILTASFSDINILNVDQLGELETLKSTIHKVKA